MLLPRLHARLGLCLLTASLLAACSTPTQLIVVVDTDLAIPGALDEVEITVSSDMGVMESERAALASDETLPLTLAVIPSGDFLGPIDVLAEGRLEGGPVVARRARVTLVRGETRMLRLDLVRACVGVDCGADASCGEAGCTPVEIEELPVWPGSPPRLGDAGVRRADAGMDGGAVDAGPLEDAGLDAAAVDAPQDDAAMSPDGGRSCADASECDDGVVCTIDACVMGLCTFTPDDAVCADTEPCTDDLCDAIRGCVFTPNAAPCDDRVFCNGADTCSGGTCAAHDGNPCVSLPVCDEAEGGCRGCRIDGECPMPSYGDWEACMFSDGCVETGTHRRSVRTYTCDAMGACVPSDAFMSESCDRDTEGVNCGTTTCGDYGPCEFADVCDEDGTATRTCLDLACGTGMCRTYGRDDGMSCPRETDGTACGPSRRCAAGSCTSCAPSLSGSFGTAGTSFLQGIMGSGTDLLFTDGAAGMASGSITASAATFAGGDVLPTCIWQVDAVGNLLRFIDRDGATVVEVAVVGAPVSGTSAPPCVPMPPGGCVLPCVERVVGTGSTLEFHYPPGTPMGTITFGCPP